MSCSNPPPADHSPTLSPAVLVGEAGTPFNPSPHADSVAAWMELMEVVEALCPRWPAPEPMIMRPGMMRL